MELDNKGENKDRVQVLERAFDILEYVAATAGCTVVEISQATGYPMPTTYRILHTLERRGWVTQDTGSKKYFIGLQCSVIGSAHNLTMTLIEHLHPEMESLSLQFRETLCLGIRVGASLQYVDQVRAMRPIEVLIPTHTPLPLYSTASGKLLLSDLDNDQIKLLLQPNSLESITEETVTYEDLFKQLDEIRSKGYAFEIGESITGMGCIAVPIYYNRHIVATLTFAGVAASKLNKQKDEMLRAIIQARLKFEDLIKEKEENEKGK